MDKTLTKPYRIALIATIVFMSLQIGRAWGIAEREIEHIYVYAPEASAGTPESTVDANIIKLHPEPLKPAEELVAASEWMQFIVTAYCCENYPHICNNGDSAKTATGTSPMPGRTIAVDPKTIPYGTNVEIEGWGIYIAEDTGGGMSGSRIDLLFGTHDDALAFGRQTLNVRVLEG